MQKFTRSHVARGNAYKTFGASTLVEESHEMGYPFSAIEVAAPYCKVFPRSISPDMERILEVEWIIESCIDEVIPYAIPQLELWNERKSGKVKPKRCHSFCKL